MIEGDPVISPALSLLRQRGSSVDMGHLRVVPLDSSILYVQPIFLSAEENAIPELYRVVVSDGENVSMDRSLAAAMAGLELPVQAKAPTPASAPNQSSDRARRALDLLERAQDRIRNGDWAGYGELMDQLRELLEHWSRATGEAGAG
jgi:uncharacterized membrane protein (UPF0182 family)